MGRALLLGLGLLAQLSTVAIVCDSVVVSIYIPSQSILKATALCTAILEGIVWITLACFTSTIASTSLSSLLRRSSANKLSIAFGCTSLLCIIASGICIASIVLLRDAADRGMSTASKESFLVASSVILAAAVACQLLFLSVYYLNCRRQGQNGAESVITIETPSPKAYVKSIAYERTRPSTAKSRGAVTVDSVDMVSLSGKKPRVQVLASPRSSLSQSIRPQTSRSRLVSFKDKQRPPSLDSSIYRPSYDANDGWDAMSGHTVQEFPSPTLLPPPRSLETIPASPVVAEVSSLLATADLEPPPPIRPRSRSYSPVPRKTSIRSIPRPPSQASEEQNIHPLFRSDSPTPPPVATPGTSVVASPDAGKVLAHRPSNQSMRRLRSNSLNSSSPLSRKSSFEAPSLRKPGDQCSIIEVDEEGDETETEGQPSPPIPDFVMDAGCRLSLTRYNSNKTLKGSDDSP